MALVLAAAGVFVYLRLAAALDETLDNGLRSRADDVAALVRQADSSLDRLGRDVLVEPDERFAQVLDPAGRVVDATPLVGDRPLLSATEIDDATRRTVTLDRKRLAGGDDPVRLLATTIVARGERLVVVVGASSEVREETLANLVAGFAVGGPVALGLVSLLGYALASAALRPVESMRRQAAAISASEPGKRLPVPAARDEIARLGETLNGMLARLETALARERSFVADASHELRTPLALMKAEFELALKRTRSVEELEAALRSAAEETERLTQLAEDLLVLARSDQGDLPVRRELLSASELLGSVKERFARRAAAVGRRLEVEAAPIDLSVDRLRAEQALGNLVENALRHGSGAIVLRAYEHEGQVELHVLDEGPGFTEAYLPRAFERFSRGEAARSGSGAGLGLAIVDVIARAHGGSARAASRADGADVWLSLPQATTSV